MGEEFSFVVSEDRIPDVEYTCNENYDHKVSLTWCEENCSMHSYCQRVAEANDALVEYEEANASG